MDFQRISNTQTQAMVLQTHAHALSVILFPPRFSPLPSPGLGLFQFINFSVMILKEWSSPCANDSLDRALGGLRLVTYSL